MAACWVDPMEQARLAMGRMVCAGRFVPAELASRLARVALGFSCALATPLLGGALQAAPAPTYPPEVFPPASVFRTLQLTTLACGRENTTTSCADARRQADPLLDHPLLPARCKDVLWSIRNLAVEAPSNTLTRRDPIDQAASELTIACRQVVKVKAEEKPQGGGGGLLKFGGGQP